MTSIIRIMNREVSNNPVKKIGRPKVYKDRYRIELSLPKKAIDRIEEQRGKQSFTAYLTEMICTNLGLSKEDIYVNC